MRSFNSMLDEQMDDPEVATVFESEIERLNAAVAVSRAREEARLTQEQLAERSGCNARVGAGASGWQRCPGHETMRPCLFHFQ